MNLRAILCSGKEHTNFAFIIFLNIWARDGGLKFCILCSLTSDPSAPMLLQHTCGTEHSEDKSMGEGNMSRVKSGCPCVRPLPVALGNSDMSSPQNGVIDVRLFLSK